MSELYKQIAWFLNELASSGKGTQDIANIIINFPIEWIREIGIGYSQGFTAIFGDTALVALDIADESIDIKTAKLPEDGKY